MACIYRWRYDWTNGIGFCIGVSLTRYHLALHSAEEGSQICKTEVITSARIEPMYSSEKVERPTSLSRYDRMCTYRGI
jgi:hypothetical protein